MRVREPGVHGRQPHLCAVTDKQHTKCGLQPCLVQVFSIGYEPVNIQVRHLMSGKGKKIVAQKRYCYTYRAYKEIFPGRLQASVIVYGIL